MALDIFKETPGGHAKENEDNDENLATYDQQENASLLNIDADDIHIGRLVDFQRSRQFRQLTQKSSTRRLTWKSSKITKMFEWIISCFCGTRAERIAADIRENNHSINRLRQIEREHMDLVAAAEADMVRTNEEALIARETLNVQMSQRELEFMRAAMRVLQKED
ncbi:hypothetical protein YC2023_052095 [Brassica napus]